MHGSQAQISPALPHAARRSAQSQAFEAFWRSLPKHGLMPARSDFQPRTASRFLPGLVLMEAPSADKRSLRIRLVGGAFEARIRQNIAGLNYADLLSATAREAALVSAEFMINRPCGLWQTMPVQYEAGFAQKLEITVFPLGPGEDGIPFFLSFAQFENSVVHAEATFESKIVANTATEFAFLDLGAGIPAWPPED